MLEPDSNTASFFGDPGSMVDANDRNVRSLGQCNTQTAAIYTRFVDQLKLTLILLDKYVDLS